jgi:hypothetical protein
MLPERPRRWTAPPGAGEGLPGSAGDPPEGSILARTPTCSAHVDLGHNKARSAGSGPLSAQPWCLPKGVGRSCARKWRGISLIVRSDGFQLWGGAAGAGTWGQVSIGTFRWVRGTWGWAVSGAMDGVAVLMTAMTRQERQRSVENCWSRGRIVSALLSSAPGGCLPSVEPPNVDAVTLGPPTGACKGRSRFDTALHRGQRGFMKRASCACLALRANNRAAGFSSRKVHCARPARSC